MNKKVMCLAGDGIGPEIMNCAKSVIAHINKNSAVKIECVDYDFGGCAIEPHGTPFPESTKEAIANVDAILLSAIGDYRYNDAPYTPEMALLDLRKFLDVYINVRPISAHKKVSHLTSFKPEVIEGVDITFYRELSSGAYFGTPRELNEEEAIDTIYYSKKEISRIVKAAFEYCQATDKRLTSVDKANVLATSKLWRKTVEEIAKDYPGVAYEHRLVDSCAMDLVNTPQIFDVIVTDNLFGDILSDQAASLVGSLGMMASASSGSGISLYEPGHGSAPDIANMNIANPYAMIKSVAMMYQHSFNETNIAAKIETALMQTIEDDIFTKDLNNENYIGTLEFARAVIERIDL